MKTAEIGIGAQAKKWTGMGCPVKFKDDCPVPFVNVGGIFAKAIAMLSHNWKYRELIDNSDQYEALDVAIKALKFIKHYYPLQFNYYLKEVDDNA